MSNPPYVVIDLDLLDNYLESFLEQRPKIEY